MTRRVPAIVALLAAVALAAPRTHADALADGFANPPPSARPWTFWFWVNGNVTKDGIRADLEDMRRVGIGGVMLFDGSLYLPPGNVRFNTDVWHEHVQHAIAVCDELGLQLSIMNCGGWATAGGPWNDVERSMKMLAWNETRTPGGAVSLKLATPPTRDNFYRDVAVLAIPNEPLADVQKVDGKAAFPMSLTFALDAAVARRAVIVPGFDAGTVEPGGDGSVESPRIQYSGTIEASDDGQTFREIGTFDDNTKDWSMPVALPFPPTTARAFRVNFRKTSGAAPRFAELHLTDAPRVAAITAQTGLRPMPTTMPVGLGDDRGAIAADKVVDLTKQLAADGTLAAELPAGEWTILRVGYTTTAATNHPAVPEATGYEVDKFDATAVARHLENGVGRLIREAGPRAGGAFAAVLSDSWEAGAQTWTARLPEHFEKRRGYAIAPYLAALTGRVVNSRAETDAFLRDFRKTLGDLYADAYFDTMARTARSHGMRFSSEGYGGPIDELKANADIDLPGVEFWNHGLYKSHARVTSAAHTNGKPIVWAEAFTSRPPDKSRFIETPALLKPLGDLSFAAGVNRFTIHSYIHQPRADIAPGFTHGRYGTQFGRLNSWWPMAPAWIDYLRRCQFLLQSGRPVSDVLYLMPERLTTEERDLGTPWPRTIRGDQFSVAHLARVVVKDGRLNVAGNGDYAAIIVPPGEWFASIDALTQLKRIADAGGTVVLAGESKPTPDGVSDLRRADEWRTLADWAAKLPANPMPVKPDFEGHEAFRFAHRKAGDVDIYFVCNPTDKPIEGGATFRAAGTPTLWNPVTGERTSADAFEVSAGRTRVGLRLAPGDSTFVVFGASAAPTTRPSGTETASDVAGPWTVTFQPNRGAPETPVTFDTLVSFPDRAEPGIKYFSGLATYARDVDVPADSKSVRLDLGNVYDLAEVRVNGTKVATLWRPPFVVDVTKSVKPGANRVEVIVANRWVNRLIGDEQLPPEAEYGTVGLNDGALKAFPKWWSQSPPQGRERVAFSVWKHYGARDALVPSGLVGPVKLLVTRDAK